MTTAVLTIVFSVLAAAFAWQGYRLRRAVWERVAAVVQREASRANRALVIGAELRRCVAAVLDGDPREPYATQARVELRRAAESFDDHIAAELALMTRTPDSGGDA